MPVFVVGLLLYIGCLDTGDPGESQIQLSDAYLKAYLTGGEIVFKFQGRQGDLVQQIPGGFQAKAAATDPGNHGFYHTAYGGLLCKAQRSHPLGGLVLGDSGSKPVPGKAEA